ncbi:uncharacterized protein K452DRAFT_220707 [Aplosporella prunicola CBS 121167]|uniref:Peptidase M20 dimerisation domain-containing protein n=1 Tax=Aplosporella prunicola CBS 121167 TaxID=1176127 RepID=A0A6A6BN24_9PEZI|nr:uncharacterized protein K452DRAFT_220707 [Aplosporella prunicola CBS 121167]KAF2145539.1 hypothetical protein K452DRAFT_220707 [Aplosporella prunicola CBS 121167]
MKLERSFEAASNKKSIALVASLIVVAFFWNLPVLSRTYYNHSISGGVSFSSSKGDVNSWCSISDPSEGVVNDGLDSSSKFLDHSSLLKQVERMSAAVKVPTESWDDNDDVDKDPRWDVFADFHSLLEQLFPLVHEELNLAKVNKHGLLYTYQGTSKDLKPILFTAHQDVVPGTSPEKWTYPPFEGHYDGQWLWGRGSVDCKNNLIGLLSVMEDLLSQDFKPKRTIVFAFGFDEETGGKRGAKALGIELQRLYGNDGIALLIDEGGMGLQTVGNYVYAQPGVGEKGKINIILTVDVAGGHSSMPPPNTGIGIMAKLISELEAHPYEPRLTQENPFRNLLECQVKYSPNKVEPWLGSALVKNEDESILGSRLAESRPEERYTFQTSQAVDVITGGEKVNALPEKVVAIVNYRVSAHDGIEKVKQNAINLLQPIAHRHGLVVNPFGHNGTKTAKLSTGSLTLTLDQPLEPAPVTLTDLDNGVWSLFSGTIRQVFEDTPSLKGKTVVPVGGIMTGNTDTQWYWPLTKNIYRFEPYREGTMLNLHTVDERIDMLTHVEIMRFYYELIRNFDQAVDL